MIEHPKISLTGLNREELRDLILKMDEPAYRADQLHHWIYIKSANSYDQMTNISKSFKNKLKEVAEISLTTIFQRLDSDDGTIKLLLEYPDNSRVETVLMRFDNRPNLTACLSSQVGCPVKCSFCATGQIGFKRNLHYTEIVDQFMVIQRNTGLKISNIVFMGQGEPLLNYDNLKKAITILNDSVEIGTRRITVSTAGVIPQILTLARDFPQLTLAISLHSPRSDIRAQLVPIQSKYPLADLIETLKEYYSITKRRITIEYVLIKGINDDLNLAKDLNTLLKDIHCNINLIPYNCIDSLNSYSTPDEKQTRMFKYILELSGKKVTVRLKRGNDILAACGQLSGKYNQ